MKVTSSGLFLSILVNRSMSLSQYIRINVGLKLTLCVSVTLLGVRSCRGLKTCGLMHPISQCRAQSLLENWRFYLSLQGLAWLGDDMLHLLINARPFKRNSRSIKTSVTLFHITRSGVSNYRLWWQNHHKVLWQTDGQARHQTSRGKLLWALPKQLLCQTNQNYNLAPFSPA